MQKKHKPKVLEIFICCNLNLKYYISELSEIKNKKKKMEIRGVSTSISSLSNAFGFYVVHDN